MGRVARSLSAGGNLTTCNADCDDADPALSRCKDKHHADEHATDVGHPCAGAYLAAEKCR